MNAADRAAALDYLNQLQDRSMRESRFSTPSPSVEEMLAKLRDPLLETMKHVIPNDEAAQMFEMLQRELSRARDPSKTPQPFEYLTLRRLCDRLRSELADPADEPVIGVLASHWLSPQYHRVPGTNLEVITVGREFFAFCDHVAKAFAATLHPRKAKDQRSFVFRIPEQPLPNTKRGRALKAHWVQLVVSYASLGGPETTPYLTTGKREARLRADMLTAMELFAIEHEYGHAIAGSDQSILQLEADDDPGHALELAADRIGQRLATQVARRERNFFLFTGLGASLLLPMLDTVHDVRSVLETGRSRDAPPSHPPTKVRIERIRTSAFASLGRNNADMAQRFDQFLERLCQTIRELSLRAAAFMHERGHRPALPGTPLR